MYNLLAGHAYNAQDRCVCAGYDNGDIKMFDLRNMSLRWETNVKNGVCTLITAEHIFNLYFSYRKQFLKMSKLLLIILQNICSLG